MSRPRVLLVPTAREGYRRAVEAFPDAHTAKSPVKCGASLDFAVALREFCAAVEG